MRHRKQRRWTLLFVATLAVLGTQARADPPIEGDQGMRLHGTGPFEHVNIPLKSGERVGPCWRLSLSQGNLEGKRKGGNGGNCVGTALVGTTFFAPYAGRIVSFTIKSARPHRNIFHNIFHQAEPPPVQRAGASVSQPLLERSNKVLWDYEVTWQFKNKSRPLCDTKSNRALIVPFAWSNAGKLIAHTAYFTFACIPENDGKGSLIGGGAIAKCIDWGYPPWETSEKTLAGNTLKGRTVTKKKQFLGLEFQNAQFHEACVHMAMADYCGEGKVNTLGGTPIAFFDIFNVGDVWDSKTGKLAPGPIEWGFHLEAAWGIDDCGRARAICLSKTRWSALSIDATCTTAGWQPPVDPFHNNIHIAYEGTDNESTRICEEQTLEDLEAKGALLFSYSAAFDKALVRFRHSDTKGSNEFLTTADVSSKDPVALTYTLDKTLTLLQHGWPVTASAYYTSEGELEGPLLSPYLPESIRDKLNLVALYRCRSKKHPERFLMTTTPNCESDPDYQPDQTPALRTSAWPRRARAEKRIWMEWAPMPVIEGYLYASNSKVDHYDGLYLWLRDDEQGRHYATSTSQPEGYGNGKLLGYLPAVTQIADAMTASEVVNLFAP